MESLPTSVYNEFIEHGHWVVHKTASQQCQLIRLMNKIMELSKDLMELLGLHKIHPHLESSCLLGLNKQGLFTNLNSSF